MDLNKHFKCSEFTHVLKIGTGVTLGHHFLEEKNRTHKICLTARIGMANDLDLKLCLLKQKICRYTKHG